MRRFSPYLGLGWLLAVSLVGCDRAESPPQPKAATMGAASAVSPGTTSGSVKDPSVPAASTAVGSTAAGTSGEDTRANNPGGSLSKQQESTEMPKGGQANSHSSPAFEGGSNKR